jgi:hypothetical protein
MRGSHYIGDTQTSHKESVGALVLEPYLAARLPPGVCARVAWTANESGEERTGRTGMGEERRRRGSRRRRLAEMQTSPIHILFQLTPVSTTLTHSFGDDGTPLTSSHRRDMTAVGEHPHPTHAVAVQHTPTPTPTPTTTKICRSMMVDSPQESDFSPQSVGKRA